MFSPKDQDRGGRRGKTILRILSEDTSECRDTDKGSKSDSQQRKTVKSLTRRGCNISHYIRGRK